MARHKPTALADLDELVAAITVDAYGDDEPQTAFLEVFIQESPLPAAGTALGTPVEVIGFDYSGERRGILACCRRDGVSVDLAAVDLIFPPEAVASWVQAAYRRWLGLTPHPFDMPARWWRLRVHLAVDRAGASTGVPVSR